MRPDVDIAELPASVNPLRPRCGVWGSSPRPPGNLTTYRYMFRESRATLAVYGVHPHGDRKTLTASLDRVLILTTSNEAISAAISAGRSLNGRS